MKISFLIPSKDRLELLAYAVESIRTQADLDYEIVIVDNSSAKSYENYVNGLKDPRVVFNRQESQVSVTENWQMALSLSSGDYILMLGDDDAIAPSFSELINSYLKEDCPDVVYLASYHYCYPAVMPGHVLGYFASVLNSEFLQAGDYPYCLTHDYATELANGVLEFRHRFGLNAQHYLLRASFIKQFESIGGIYQSPYPDTFSSVAIFLNAKSIVVISTELVIIGISPKSFGAYYFSGRYDEGYVFLDNLQVAPDVRDKLEPVLLPGDPNDANWLVAAEAVRQAFPDKLRANVDVTRYRALQMVSVLRTGARGGMSSPGLNNLRSMLTEDEGPLFAALEASVRASEDERRNKLFDEISKALGQYHPAKVRFIDLGLHDHIGDAINFLRTGQTRSLDDPEKDPASRPAPRADAERVGPDAPRLSSRTKGAPGRSKGPIRRVISSLWHSDRTRTK